MGESRVSLSLQHQSQPTLNSSLSRLQGITVDDLDVGHMKTPTRAALGLTTTMSQQQQRVLNTDSPRVEALTKSIKKTKKLIKRTCRDVWTERDEIVHLQRKNWSTRKALLQTDVPKDSATTLNLKLEKAIRKERELSLKVEECLEEKEQVDVQCSDLTDSIEEFKDLLDALKHQILPLLPSEDDDDDGYDEFLLSSSGPSDRNTADGGQTLSPLARVAAREGANAAAAVIRLLDEDDFSDSIDSTEDIGMTMKVGHSSYPAAGNKSKNKEGQPEASLSLRRIRNSSVR
jgi:hypothetical protein